MANLILIIVVAAIAVLLLAIKTNAALVFFALCAGSVLIEFANKNMAYVNGHLNNSLIPHRFVISQPSLELAILFAPPVVIAALVKHNQGISKWPLQIFPAVATGILAVLLAVPLLSSSLQHTMTNNKFWNLLEQNQIPIVALCVAASLVVIVMMSYSGHHSGHHSKHHLLKRK